MNTHPDGPFAFEARVLGADCLAMAMALERFDRPPVLHLKALGPRRLDARWAEALGEVFVEAIGHLDHAGSAIVDLSFVEAIDRDAWDVFSRAARRALARGATLSFCRISPALRDSAEARALLGYVHIGDPHGSGSPWF